MSRKIPAGEFKAKCLALMDEVNRTGEEIVVTKRGKPVVRVVPEGAAPPHPSLLGTVHYQCEEDLLAPTGEVWEVDE